MPLTTRPKSRPRGTIPVSTSRGLEFTFSKKKICPKFRNFRKFRNFNVNEMFFFFEIFEIYEFGEIFANSEFQPQRVPVVIFVLPPHPPLTPFLLLLAQLPASTTTTTTTTTTTISSTRSTTTRCASFCRSIRVRGRWNAPKKLQKILCKRIVLAQLQSAPPKLSTGLFLFQQLIR